MPSLLLGPSLCGPKVFLFACTPGSLCPASFPSFSSADDLGRLQRLEMSRLCGREPREGSERIPVQEESGHGQSPFEILYKLFWVMRN